MQKVFVFLPILLIILAVEFAAANNRARRFCCPDASSAGGRLGCVVSQNKLFINGRFVKDLSEDEQQELNIYKQAQQDFKEQVHTYLEQRFNASNEAQVESLKKPVPPKKPSFCSSKARTQYVFDGCTVQGDSVFIGDQFVRKLDDEEQQQLKEFDKQFNSYQKAMSGQIRRQVQEAFGHAFGQLFGHVGGGSDEGTTAEDGETEGGENATELASSTAESAEVGAKNSTLPELPKVPEFCTLIV